MIINDETYVATREGTELVKMTEKRFNALSETAKKEGKEAPELASIQTFRKKLAENLQEALELCSAAGEDAEKVATTYFNRGLGLRQETLITDVITDSEFAPVDGVYDLTEDAGKLPTRTTRKKQASAEDLVAMLRNLPKDQMDKILGMFATAGAVA